MFTVTTKDNTALQYSAVELLTQLVGRLMSTEMKPDHEAMVEAIVKRLEPSLANATYAQVIEMAFRLGFTYRVACERNNVVYSAPSDSTNVTESSE
jgi:hypothetical protein